MAVFVVRVIGAFGERKAIELVVTVLCGPELSFRREGTMSSPLEMPVARVLGVVLLIVVAVAVCAGTVGAVPPKERPVLIALAGDPEFDSEHRRLETAGDPIDGPLSPAWLPSWFAAPRAALHSSPRHAGPFAAFERHWRWTLALTHSLVAVR